MSFPALSKTTFLAQAVVPWAMPHQQRIVWSIIIGVMIVMGTQAIICALLHESLTVLAQEHRRVTLTGIWLLMIPGFNLFWNFLVFHRVAASYACQFRAADQPNTARSTEILAPLAAAGLLLSVLLAILVTQAILVAAWFVTFTTLLCLLSAVLLIIYLAKLTRLKNALPDFND